MRDALVLLMDCDPPFAGPRLTVDLSQEPVYQLVSCTIVGDLHFGAVFTLQMSFYR